MSRTDVFVSAVESVLARYLRQTGQATAGAEKLELIAQRLVGLMREKDVPRALRPEERGEPGELPPEVIEPLVARITAELEDGGELRPAVMQLVKACFYPPFRRCRESYREADASGHCRRQELARARTRVSGSHCVDCPYWTDLSPDQHARCLRAGWHGDPAEFERHRDIFLPGDFREVRRAAREFANTPETQPGHEEGDESERPKCATDEGA